MASAAFLLTAAAVDRAAGPPRAGALSEKILYFWQSGDEFDLVFFGSSRVYRGVVPARFDAALADRGVFLRSFNFGVAGMEPLEVDALVRRVLSTRPARLRWAVIELGPWDPRLPAANRFKRRAILWHDGPATLSALRLTASSPLAAPEKLDLAAAHALHFAARTSAAGRGREALGRDASPSARRERLACGRGWEPFPAAVYEDPSLHPLRRRFVAAVERYGARLEAVPAGNRRPLEPPAAVVAALRRQTAALRRAGVEPIYLIPPVPRATPELYALARREPGLVVVGYNDPAAYPALFAPASRFDAEHLSTAAAERFSTLLAADLAPRLRRAVAAPRLARAL